MKKESKSKHSAPSTFNFDSLEEQTSHALSTLLLLERVCEDHFTTNTEFEDQEVQAMAMLLYHSRLLLKPLDLKGVAAALDLKQFALVPRGDKGRTGIACARCSQEKGGLQS